MLFAFSAWSITSPASFATGSAINLLILRTFIFQAACFYIVVNGVSVFLINRIGDIHILRLAFCALGFQN